MKLINALKTAGIEANITVGGVSIHCTPEQINRAKAICNENHATFDAGFTAAQESVLLKSSDGYDLAKKQTNNSLSIIKEWDAQK